MTAIVVAGAVKRYGPVLAVDGVDLAIASGSFMALLGPSGCGKTTLLRLIAGLERCDAGAIRLDEVDVTATPPWSRPVNTVFQSYALFPHLTVAGNIAYGLQREAMPRAAIAARVAEMVRLVRLDGLEERRPHALSGGQRQRVALARALAKLPKVLLLDEPMAALDRGLREETREQLKRLQERLGITFVLVTHDQEEAMALAHRVAVMRAGRIVQVGAPREIYERPVDRGVAAFMGRATLIDGKVVRAEGPAVALDAGPFGRVVGVATRALPVGAAATLVLRPERVRLDAGGDCRIEAIVRRVAFLGELTMLSAEVAPERSVSVALSGAVAAPREGERVILSWLAAEAAVVAA
jgi:putrescine transport system ATP-binding protein